MTKYFLIFFSLFSVLYGQRISRVISWDTETVNQKNNIKQESFKEASYESSNNFLPQYQEMIPISGNEAEISFSDFQFEPFNNQEIDKSTLSASIEFAKKVVSAQKQNYAAIHCTPLRINPLNGQVEKLVSFNVNVSSSNNSLSFKNAKSSKPNSAFASGQWFKIAVPADDIYKIDYAFIQDNNISNGNINFSNFGIFGQAMGLLPELNSARRVDDVEEIPIKIVDVNNNGFWEQGDYVLFYGKGPHLWSYENGNYIYTTNYYTNKSGYFITTNRGSGKTLVQNASLSGVTSTSTNYDFRAVFEEELTNLIYTELAGTMGSGREWFGKRLNNFSNTEAITIDIPNIISASPASISVNVAANSSSLQSSFTLSNNGNVINTLSVSAVSGGSYPEAAKNRELTFSQNLSSNNNFEIKFANNDPQATGYLDYLQVVAKANLTKQGNVLFFRNADVVGPGNVVSYVVNGVSSNTEIWDVTNGVNPIKINGNLNGSQFTFSVAMDTLREFVALDVNTSSYNTPSFEGSMENQNLHNLDQQDLFIITTDALFSAASRLANFHRDNGKKVAVVDVNKIYNEFSSGQQDLTAIRDFLKLFYDRATNYEELPKYALLFGDASFDYKGIVDDSQNIIPTYESYESFSQTKSYCTDDYIAFLDDNEGEGIEQANNINRLDVAVGRIPVDNIAEANAVVDKIIGYNTQSTMNDWRNNLCFVADDEDNNLHYNQVENLTSLSTIENKDFYNIEKIYLDAYSQENAAGGDRYPTVNDVILRKLKTGVFLMNYTGHGGPRNWAQERVFNIEDIRNLDNKDNLPLFITATCDFSPYDDVEFHSAGETLITNGEGGAIALLTTTRVVYAHENFLMNSQVLDYLFQDVNGRKPTIGEVVMQAKNAASQSENNRKFVLLGDPALTLAYPQYNVITTAVNGSPIPQIDTLKALERVTIEGEVHDLSGNLLTGFNGVVYPTVFDKEASYQTKGQDAGSSVASFSLQNNILFKGKASVSNGKFAYEFIVPKDINYAFDNGKISYYSANNNATSDAHGYTYDVIIGGTSSNIESDNKGPQVDVFMNDSTFAFGGLTDDNPILLVSLQDASGINTVGNGVGHDIIGLLNENTQEQYLLNEFYEATLDDFTKGNVEYPFNKLEDGRYSVRVKAWDVHNNPGEGYTEFVVASSEEIALRNVLNYPNPFTTNTSFIFEHNRPGEMLTVNVQIFTVSGKVVKNIEKTILSEGYNVMPNEITWNGLDDYGDLIGKGVYIYKVNVQGENGFSAQEFQKLVILR